MERTSICFSKPGTRTVLQNGDPGFSDEIRRLYDSDESDALESLTKLKAELRTLSTDDFWSAATEGMSSILGAEMAFIMKRVLVDEQDAAVEMPPLGEPGSCMMAAAFHYCAKNGSKYTLKQSKFHAYGCPCAYMRHDKIFVIPEGLSSFITNNPNKLPTPAEAYIALPLFAEGKCFAHFGAMWSKEGAAQRRLSWGFIEVLMHALDDLIVHRFLEGSHFIRPPSASVDKQRVIPHDVVTVAQSLRPYAGSLSHELRTPMQGVVGMLDVMYATVQEAVDTQRDPRLRKIFQDLKENIEVVQDSSRRAVEAADNVVHAYDMDMSIPDVPASLDTEESNDTLSPFSTNGIDRRPEILVAGSNLPFARPNKRRRDEAFSRQSSRQESHVSQAKVARVEGASSLHSRTTEASREIKEGFQAAEDVEAHAQRGATLGQGRCTPTTEHNSSHRVIAPGLRHTHLREMLQYVIHEGLKLGGRPDSAMAQETDLGESIEVRTRGLDGSASTKFIDWSIDPSVPATIFIDEKDLSKLISCVFLNAIKFTDSEQGRITINARMSSRARYISFRISDNGPGIPAAFLPKLFKPFSQENGSITRRSEGLGLGLMVAKGIARKLGGDLVCTGAETEGPNHGSEFEIKLPIIAGETVSRSSSPFGSPMPRRAHGVDQSVTPNWPPAPSSPRNFARALHEAVNEGLLSCVSLTSAPTSPKSQPYLSVLQPRPTVESAPSPPSDTSARPKSRSRVRKSVSSPDIDRDLAKKYPLTFLVADDNNINRRLLVSMLAKFGYKATHQAHNGAEAVRQMSIPRPQHEQIDVVLMDLWMPLMDGYEATERILGMDRPGREEGLRGRPTVLAVTADVTNHALERAASVGMKGFMTKPYKLLDLQRLITEYCARSQAEADPLPATV